MDGFVTFTRIADHQRFYAALIAPGTSCFDIGANHGERTAALLSLGGSVVAVEPQPELAAFIASSLAGECERGRLTVVNAALGASAGRARLYPASDPTRSMSTLSEVFIEVSQANGDVWDVSQAFDVEVATLENLIEEHFLPGYCKIDVEGYDLEVLKGLSTPVDLISFEYNTQPRLIGIATECIDYLHGLDDYCFNYQSEIPGQQNLQLETWVDARIMRYILEHDIARQLCFGDVFARRRRAKQFKPRSAAGLRWDRK
jgi:FkbM family methyltransferase